MQSLIDKIAAVGLASHSSTASTLASYRGAVLVLFTSTEATAKVVVILARCRILWQDLTSRPDIPLCLLLAQAVLLQDGSNDGLEGQGSVRHLGMQFPVYGGAIVQALLHSGAEILIISCNTLVCLADGVKVLVTAGLAAIHFVLHHARGRRHGHQALQNKDVRAVDQLA